MILGETKFILIGIHWHFQRVREDELIIYLFIVLHLLNVKSFNHKPKADKWDAMIELIEKFWAPPRIFGRGGFGQE